MDYNLATLRRDVSFDMLDDEEYDVGIIDRALNRTQREIFNQFELTFMEEIFSGTIQAGSVMLNYPANLATVQQHVLTTGEGKRNIESSYLPFREFTRMYPDPESNAPSDIKHWTSYGGRILFSAPVKNECVLDIYYIRKPKTLESGTDVPEIPEEFSELLVLGAYYRITKRNEDMDLADVAIQSYAGMLNKLVERYGYRKVGPVKMKTRYVGRG